VTTGQKYVKIKQRKKAGDIRMKQLNFLAEDNRLSRLSEMGDPLEKVSGAINWEVFRPTLDEAFYHEAKGPGGRPPLDRVMIFKIVMLQQWYHIADDNTEYMINDRLSFQRFLGLSLNDKVPDAKTIWAFKEKLKENNTDLELFSLFADLMEDQGVITREGSIVDASFVDVPRQRNSRRENEIIKKGGVPEEWQEEGNENKLPQKDLDARWAKKNDELHYGYKDHVKVDKDSKMVVDFTVTAANVHDSQCFHELLDEKDDDVYADSAYVGEELHEDIAQDFPNIHLHINEKGYKNKPLTDEQKGNNREKSKVRARVEHIFGHMTNSMGGMFIRCVGINRAIREIAMKNLAYNLQRFTYLAGIAKKSAA
jgi:IS5 family transposase